MQLNEMLQSLCLAPGVGAMTEAGDLAASLLAPYCTKVERDPLGSVIGWCGKDESLPTLMLEAHIDEIGFVVTGVDDKGFLQVSAAGGVDNRVITATEVVVHGDKPYAGVFCSVPPHLGGGDLPAVTDRGIDVGMTAEEAKEHIPVGSFVAFRPQYAPLLGERVTATSLDDRAGVAVVLRCLELLKDKPLPCRLAVLFSVQEEMGLRGATAGAFAVNPVAAISTDVSFATAPGEKGDITAKLGGGPLIGVSPSLDMALSRRLVALAKAADIPFQYEGMGGFTGTNADKIGVSRGGVRTALLSIPLRYMHTPVEVADLRDIENTARLMAEFVEHWGETAC
ncbi:MAG: M42 family peptidase [Clostridia bacterium]|nr:M42 family peptidase [Clostridia bacterium]